MLLIKWGGGGGAASEFFPLGGMGARMREVWSRLHL